MGTVLITGAAGFIGSAIAKNFLKKKIKVVTVDNLSTGKRINLPDGIIFYEGNCHDPNLIKKLEKYDFNAIFHIAGQSSGEISFDDPIYDFDSNTKSTILLLELALKINCNYFYYASSMSIYGFNKNMVVIESDFNNPNSFYGVSKMASEHYLRLYEKKGINSISYRLFNVYGPGQNLNNLRQGMVSIFLAYAFYEKNILIKGSLDRFRDFIFIDDVVSAFEIGYDKKLEGHNIFNLSTGIKTSVEELIKMIIGLFDEKISYKVKGETLGDINGIAGINKKIKEKLNWNPKTKLKEGIKIMYKSITYEK